MSRASPSSAARPAARVAIVLAASLAGWLGAMGAAEAHHRPDHVTGRPTTTTTTTTTSSTTPPTTTAPPTTAAPPPTEPPTTTATTSPPVVKTRTRVTSTTPATTAAAPVPPDSVPAAPEPPPAVEAPAPTPPATDVAVTAPPPSEADLAGTGLPPVQVPAVPAQEPEVSAPVPATPDHLAIAPPGGGGGSAFPRTLVATVLAMAACIALLSVSWSRRRLAVAGVGIAEFGPVRPSAVAMAADVPPARLGDRLVVLLALAARAHAEYVGQGAVEARDDIVAWVLAAGAAEEVDPDERAMLLAAPGSLNAAALADASWQVEAAAVLAWALGLLDGLPPFDRATDPAILGEALGFPDGARTRAVLGAARSRGQEAIDHEAERYAAVGRRLLAATGEAGDGAGLPPPPAALAASSIAVAGRPIAEADPAAVEVALEITATRLRALRWLDAGGPYPSIDT